MASTLDGDSLQATSFLGARVHRSTGRFRTTEIRNPRFQKVSSFALSALRSLRVLVTTSWNYACIRKAEDEVFSMQNQFDHVGNQHLVFTCEQGRKPT